MEIRPIFQSQTFGESGGTMFFSHLTWLKINNQFSGSSLNLHPTWIQVNRKYIGISSHTTQPIKYEDTNFEHLLETTWKKVNFLEL